MKNKTKKIVSKVVFFDVIFSLFISAIVFIISGSIYAAFLIGFAIYLYSIGSLYIYYQKISREGKNENTKKGID